MIEQAPGFNIDIPFAQYLGINFKKKEIGRVEISVKIKREYKNSWGSAHGGLIMTMLDVALGSACRSLDDRCNGAITVEMKVNFLHPVKDEMKAYGCATKIGKSLIFSEGIIKDCNEKIIAKANGTFKLTFPRMKNEG